MRRLTASLSSLLLIAVATTAGCAKTQEDVGSVAAKQAQSRVETITIPDGTAVVASLDTHLSTETNHSGDPFTATIVEPIIVSGKTVVPSGAKIHGALRDVQASGRVEGRARMTLAYATIVDAKGKSYPLSALPLTLQAASATGDDVEKIAAGTVLGAIIGGVAGGGKGAAIGAGAGAGAGTILMLATKGDDLELNPGQKLAVHMTGPMSVQVLDR
jgi:alkylhydroperoxidase family enzyme